MSWDSSTRRQRLPKDWPKIRLRVKRRARGRCQADIHEPDCTGLGSECDHIIPGDDHSMANLQWLSTPCHKAKTQRESRLPTKTRPKPQHPGVLP